jgi:hypothetical protein
MNPKRNTYQYLLPVKNSIFSAEVLIALSLRLCLLLTIQNPLGSALVRLTVHNVEELAWIFR